MAAKNASDLFLNYFTNIIDRPHWSCKNWSFCMSVCRLLDDDHFGVGEALSEEQYGVGLVARGQHLLLLHR